MKLQTLFKKNNKKYININKNKDVPDGILRKCKKCNSVVFAKDVAENNYICPKCGGYFRVHAKRRIEMIADKDSFIPWFQGIEEENPLNYPNYEKKLKLIKEKTGLDEAVTTGEITITGIRVAVGVCDGRFLMASMGKVVGEKITRMVERATQEKLPVIIFACSGGARMQEGIVSLMQMAKTSAALKKHHQSGNLYISVLTDPTTGGVTASFAMLGDIILAEPKALIGFAGPRVIEQTIGEKLPKGFQRSEFLEKHGFIDGIVKRENMRDTLSRILIIHNNTNKEIPSKYCKIIGLKENNQFLNEDIKPWDRVKISRKKTRPVGTDYIERLFPDFIEMHGDRNYGDDGAIIGGIATFHNVSVTVIAQAKGNDTKSNIKRNFGMPSPEGYRKALRLMKQAEKFNRPIICFVDTPGAFCGIEAEERGQGSAIANNLFEMSDIKVPIVSIVIGEGGSGGALAMAVADEVWMLENSIYSILSPEGYASILWKDGKLAAKAANMMKMTSYDLLNMKIIQRVFKEPENYSRENMDEVILQLNQELAMFINEKSRLSGKEIAENRYNRFRKM